jgi:acyl-coenzyme A synthetase/AMP-(fatty) acid ligase
MGGTSINGRRVAEHPGSVGRVLPGYELQVLGDRRASRALRAKSARSIFLPLRGQGPPTATSARSPRRWASSRPWATWGGWTRTAICILADRRVDMILSGGANVYPAEVEAAIDAFPGVQCSVVIGLPDGDLGQKVHAIVETADGRLDEAALTAFLGERHRPLQAAAQFRGDDRTAARRRGQGAAGSASGGAAGRLISGMKRGARSPVRLFSFRSGWDGITPSPPDPSSGNSRARR